MLRPLNLFKNSNLTPTSTIQQKGIINKEKQESKEDLELKLEKISKEVSNFILDSKNAYSEQKKELVNILENFTKSQQQQPLSQQPLPQQILPQQPLPQQPLPQQTAPTNIDLLKQKRFKKTYSKVVGDVVDKIKMLYPSIKSEYFDKLYISGEDIYYKSSNKYTLMDTQLYCKLSK